MEYINALLEYDRDIKILGEMKPNEPMDSCFSPTAGHFLALAENTVDPGRVGVLIESAHAVLANLEPSDEMGFALALGKLWGIHLNDQNNLKFDQDKTFGSVNLRRAFSQIYLLDKYNYGQNGSMSAWTLRRCAHKTTKIPQTPNLQQRKLPDAIRKSAL